MLVSSAAVPIGTTPAINANSYTGRDGEWCSFVFANHAGTRPSRAIEYQTRGAPGMNENSTVCRWMPRAVRG